MRILANGMKLSVLVLPALLATSLYAQGPGRLGGATGTRTPPSPQQLAANELTRIARFLKLDSAQTSTLTGDTTLVNDLTTEQTTLQANAATVRAAYTALADDIIAGHTADEPTQESTIQTTNNLSLQARVTAAGQVLSALPSLGITVSSTQEPNLVKLLIGVDIGFGR